MSAMPLLVSILWVSITGLPCPGEDHCALKWSLMLDAQSNLFVAGRSSSESGSLCFIVGLLVVVWQGGMSL